MELVSTPQLRRCPVVTPNRESVKQVSVKSNTYSAEYGRNSGAQFQVVSQNGTNDSHGRATTGWFDTDDIGIDIGITLLRAENLHSGFVWHWLMQNPEIPKALDAVHLTLIAKLQWRRNGNPLRIRGLHAHASTTASYFDEPGLHENTASVRHTRRVRPPPWVCRPGRLRHTTCCSFSILATRPSASSPSRAGSPVTMHCSCRRCVRPSCTQA